MHKKYYILSLALAIMLSACAFQQVVPETPRQKYTQAELQFTGAIQTATRLVQQGVLSESRVQEIDALIDTISATMDSVKELLVTDEFQAQTELRLATDLLWQLAIILDEEDKK
jgi:peptidoglycan hydrolase CwlO-like protein